MLDRRRILHVSGSIVLALILSHLPWGARRDVP
jgi:hypothetical protein